MIDVAERRIELIQRWARGRPTLVDAAVAVGRFRTAARRVAISTRARRASGASAAVALKLSGRRPGRD